MQWNRRGVNRRAFSLIEVLIGVLVLALALLGLGALFPVIVREQRLAREAIMGVSAQRSAEAVLAGLTGSPSANAWNNFSRSLSSEDPKWDETMNPGDTARALYPMQLPANYPEGTITIGGTGGQKFRPIDRCVPAGAETPQFIWDMAACMIDPPVVPLADGTFVRDPYRAFRVAIFVRRIDPNIKTPGNISIRRAIIGGYRPVGILNGESTLNGTGVFSPPLYADVLNVAQNASTGAYDLIRLSAAQGSAGAGFIEFTKQIGQKFVDSLGTVYTLVQFKTDTQQWQVTPALDAPARALQRQNDLQVVFTPQIPASVTVRVVRP
jgi:prepilin-type N-terminal cleavage/methylation domain-containing protein